MPPVDVGGSSREVHIHEAVAGLEGGVGADGGNNVDFGGLLLVSNRQWAHVVKVNIVLVAPHSNMLMPPALKHNGGLVYEDHILQEGGVTLILLNQLLRCLHPLLFFLLAECTLEGNTPAYQVRVRCMHRCSELCYTDLVILEDFLQLWGVVNCVLN